MMMQKKQLQIAAADAGLKTAVYNLNELKMKVENACELKINVLILNDNAYGWKTTIRAFEAILGKPNHQY